MGLYPGRNASDSIRHNPYLGTHRNECFGHMDHGGIHVHIGGDNLHIAFAMAHVLRMD